MKSSKKRSISTKISKKDELVALEGAKKRGWAKARIKRRATNLLKRPLTTWPTDMTTAYRRFAEQALTVYLAPKAREE